MNPRRSHPYVPQFFRYNSNSNSNSNPNPTSNSDSTLTGYNSYVSIDECAPPPEGMVLVVPNPNDAPEGDVAGDEGGTGNGSICLLGRCMWSNITLGQNCLIENTTYMGYDHSGMSFTNTVIRDNCIQGQGYCDTSSNTCLPLLKIGQGCSTDRECQSYNCERGLCVIPPESAVKIGKWVYALTGVSIFIGRSFSQSVQSIQSYPIGSGYSHRDVKFDEKM
uniref:Uncharacterized protein n=1 Tax=Kwoniella dejecticola CBS 10117 TaxID=1296121 RepID=A0A1A6A4R5_9TREE|nr:uncharacterized protein I303_04375 [Kwoniella dejecticola CBS 10117]OBR85047.1 hypothetical protein I303_04375 [Kwoniella dejecticola CBS 10117]